MAGGGGGCVPSAWGPQKIIRAFHQYERLPGQRVRERAAADDVHAVSYTHLTLPTILRV